MLVIANQIKLDNLLQDIQEIAGKTNTEDRLRERERERGIESKIGGEREKERGKTVSERRRERG